MKKVISLTIALCLVLGSFSFCFADFTSSDSTNLSNLTSYTNTIKNALTSSNGTIYSFLNLISNRLYYGSKGAANWLSDIENHLATTLYQSDGDNTRSIAWWVKEAVLDLDTIAGTGTGTISFNILEILNQLSYFSSGGARQSWLQKIELDLLNNGIYLNTVNSNVQTLRSDVATIKSVNTANLPGIYAYSANIDTTTSTYLPYLDPLQKALTNYKPGATWSNVTQSELRTFSHVNLIDDLTTGRYAVNEIQSDGTVASRNIYWGNGTPIANLAAILKRYTNSFVAQHSYLISNFWKDTSSNDWIAGSKSNFYTLESRSANLSTQQNTPLSFSDKLFKYLQKTQYDTARLSYVLASDFDIEASQKAQPNQEAVVDNFIDSSGAGSVSTTDIGSLSSAADSYKTNASTGASATGVWSVFDQSNYNWFSQTTANNLDTSANTRKAAADYDTPLLDDYYSYMTDYIKENPDD